MSNEAIDPTGAPSRPTDEVVELAVVWHPTPGSTIDERLAVWTGSLDAADQGRDGAAFRRWPVPSLRPGAVRARTTEVRRSGAHALVRPGLAVDRSTVGAAVVAFTRLVGRTGTVTMPPLHLSWRDGALHLVADGPCPTWTELVTVVTGGLDHLRRRGDGATRDLHRRRGLTLREELMLLRWGHPGASPDRRFAIRITDRLPVAERPSFELGACSWFAPVMAHPWVLSELTLVQVDRITGVHRVAGVAAMASGSLQAASA
jgi:hypothetical protein